MIPITKPNIDETEVNIVSDVLRSGWLTQGPIGVEFENTLATYLNAKAVVAVSSCTTALHLAVLLAELKPGDEVLLPSYTFVATANSLLYAGIQPVFVEIDPKTYNINPDILEAYLTPKTKAVLAVDQFGLACDQDKLMAFCTKHKLEFIQDSACALGGKYKGEKIGSNGKYVTLSFHPRKSITTAEGGALITNNEEIAKKARILRSHGASVSDLERHKAKGTTYESYTELGFNYRLSDVHSAIGLAQIKKLDKIVSRRRELANNYREKLKKISWIESPFEPEYAYHPYQTFAALVKKEAPINRNDLIQHLANHSISSRRGIPPIHKEPYIQKFTQKKFNLPITEDISNRTIILPLFPQMTDSDQDQVVDALIKAQK